MKNNEIASNNGAWRSGGRSGISEEKAAKSEA